MNYPINDIFPCIQGEGCLTGVAMVMLRLHGCEVGCPWCDTKETWKTDPKNKRKNITDSLGQNQLYIELCQSEIAHYITTQYPTIKWVLVSGGEPAQYNLKPLVNSLHDTGLKTALETSGTEIGHINAGFDWICVSPKIAMPGGKVIKSQALEIADEIKHVVGKPEHIDQLDQLLKNVTLKDNIELCLQPISQLPKATQLCVETVQSRGWRLSIQVHKYLNIK